MAKKTARPEMTWIENRKKWRKRIVINGKSKDVYGDTKQEVRDKIKDLERQAEAGLVIDDETTLVQYIKKWFPVKTANLKYNSIKIYVNAIDVHIAPFFENSKLKDIKPLNIQQFMASRAHLSKSMQSKNLFTLNQIFNSAIENGLISKNPCENAKAGGAPAKKKVPLSKEDQQALTSAVKDSRAELFVLLCLYAGLRREEALGLIWQNVHLESDTPYIDVRHTVTFDAQLQAVHSIDLKSKAAYRSIPIPQILYSALSNAKKQAASIFVLPAVRSRGAMNLSAFKRMWDLAVKSVPDIYIAPHLLRHTYITELCSAGIDVKKIQYLAGHEDVRMTLQVYAHVTQNTPAQLGKLIDNVFPSGSNSGSQQQKIKSNA